MKNIQIKLLIADIKYIVRFPALLCALLSPVIIAILLLFAFPLISGLTRSEDAFLFDRYYTVTAITLISAIPLIYGLLFSFVHQTESVSSENKNEFAGKAVNSYFKLRIAFSVFLGFCVILPLIYLTDAVSTEGWLRNIYASLLLAVMTSLIFLFSICFARNDKGRKMAFFVGFISDDYSIWLISSPSMELFYLFFTLLLAKLGMDNTLTCREFNVWNYISGDCL